MKETYYKVVEPLEKHPFYKYRNYSKNPEVITPEQKSRKKQLKKKYKFQEPK